MPVGITGDPARLEAYSQDTLPTIDPLASSIEGYGDALAAYNAAGPNDLGFQLSDRSAALLGEA
jgi:hypothetical protein